MTYVIMFLLSLSLAVETYDVVDVFKVMADTIHKLAETRVCNSSVSIEWRNTLPTMMNENQRHYCRQLKNLLLSFCVHVTQKRHDGGGVPPCFAFTCVSCVCATDSKSGRDPREEEQ